jgi:DNA (cytosine-5)-methyltransferase 1
MRPVCLEVCPGQGGSTRGLMDAGWDVIAVDNNAGHLARNPARWKVPGDAFDAIEAFAAEVDLIWAGFPCQDYCAGTRSMRAHGVETGHERLIGVGREALMASGRPWVMENVEGARSELRHPVMLCGSMFSLGAVDDDGTPLVVERHRLFESSEFLLAPFHFKHPRTRPVQVAGVYGGARSDKVAAREVRKGGYTPAGERVQCELLGGVDWMTATGRRLAIPPAYSAFLGAQLLAVA